MDKKKIKYTCEIAIIACLCIFGAIHKIRHPRIKAGIPLATIQSPGLREFSVD